MRSKFHEVKHKDSMYAAEELIKVVLERQKEQKKDLEAALQKQRLDLEYNHEVELQKQKKSFEAKYQAQLKMALQEQRLDLESDHEMELLKQKEDLEEKHQAQLEKALQNQKKDLEARHQAQLEAALQKQKLNLESKHKLVLKNQYDDLRYVHEAQLQKQKKELQSQKQTNRVPQAYIDEFEKQLNDLDNFYQEELLKQTAEFEKQIRELKQKIKSLSANVPVAKSIDEIISEVAAKLSSILIQNGVTDFNPKQWISAQKRRFESTNTVPDDKTISQYLMAMYGIEWTSA